MKILIYFICFLVLISTVHSLRQRFDKSRNLSPRGHRHHIFNNFKPAKTSNKRKTTQVTKIVTVSDNGKETVKKFNHHNDKMINNWDSNQQNGQSVNHHQNQKHVNRGQGIIDYDYQTNHHAHNQNWKQEMNNHIHPPNPYPDGSYPTNPHFNPHRPHPPPNPMYETPYHPWNLPKNEEYTTQCCKTFNVSTSDTSNDIIRGNTKDYIF